MTEITQAARDMAAEHGREYLGWSAAFRMAVRNGKKDDDYLVPAFQRAIDYGVAVERERCAKVALQIRKTTRSPNDTRIEIAAAIRTPAKVSGEGGHD